MMKYEDTRIGFNAPIDRKHYEEGDSWQIKQLFGRAGDWIKEQDDSPGRFNRSRLSFGIKVAAILLIPGTIAVTDPEGIGRTAGRLTSGFMRAAAGEAVCPASPARCNLFTQLGGYIGRWPQRIKSGFEDGLQ